VAKENPDKFIYSTQDAAEFFGVHRDTMTDWANRGAPKEGRGKWNIKAVMEWRFKTDSRLGEESAVVRKLKAEADLKEIKKQQEAIRLAVQEGKYISIEQTSRDLARLFTSLKNGSILYVAGIHFVSRQHKLKKMLRRYVLYRRNIFFILTERRSFMTPEEFVVYVDNLPDACIDKRTAEEVIFHLPKKKHTCPACGS